MTVANIHRLTGVQSAIQRASQRTGIDFNYLLGQAQVESGLNATARAPTSSATGLYQFIEQSWLGVVKAHGAEHGLGWAADSIRQTSSGRYVVDGGARSAILALRNDPGTASLMAAEHASDNRDALGRTLDRDVTGTDLYMAHFLGLGGARQFLRAHQANPDRPAATMFPAAARANRAVFYTPTGAARSLGEVYDRFAAKLDRGAAASGGTPAASGAVDAFATDPEVEVVLGSAAAADERAWVRSTLARLNGDRPAPARAAELMRPNPGNARLAYMMLAQMNGAL